MDSGADEWSQPAARDLLQPENDWAFPGDPPAHESDNVDDRCSEARNCTHCSKARDIPGLHQLSWEDCQYLFHSACPCDEAAPHKPDDQQVCASCRHLRLRHLFSCPAEDVSDGYPSYPRLSRWKFVSLGRIREFFEPAVQRSFCPLCRFWAALAARFAPEFSDQPFVIRCCANYLRYLTATVMLGDDYCEEAGIDVSIQCLRPLTGGRTSPLPEDRRDPPPQIIDWKRTADWLHECCQNHEGCSPKEAGSLPTDFRVIDVQERKLVLPTLPCRYVALSYVWGSGLDPSKLMGSRSNIKSLENPGSLRPSALPRTIVDAMTVCERLSQRYLWADCLCIVQDDPDDKRAQIGLMASIYTAAEVVLVVASGSSMDQAIPGVSVDRQGRILCSALGLRLTESTSKKPWDLLGSSVWATRGWTYQEGILPSRKLYITDREVWFECGEAIIREDAYADWGHEKYLKTKHYETPVSLWLGGLHRVVNVPDDERPWDSYKWHLSQYTGRSLSNDYDIFNAFMGILHPLFDDYGGTNFGLPLAKFDRALLWASSDSTSPMRPGVPTWSWGSMRGWIAADGLRCIGTLVRWSRYSESEKDLVDISIPEDQWPEEWIVFFIKAATYLAMAWAHGILEKPCPKELDHRSVPFDELNTIATLRWPLPRDLLDEALGSVKLNSFNSLEVRKIGILCGRVQTAVLKITRGDREDCEKVRRSSSSRRREDVVILDRRGDRIGFLAHLHDPTLESQIGPGVLDGGIDGEFVALSVSVDTPPEGLYIDERTQHEPGRSAEMESRRKKIQEWSVFDCDGRGSYPYPIVNVMLIWTDAEGYCYRIGIGWVMMTKWAEAKRTFKNIALK